MSLQAVRIGCCITPHGLGHAARACAVLEALSARLPVHFEIVSTAPNWFFQQSLTAPFILHALPTDVGLVQHDSLREDIDLTLTRLDAFYPLQPELVRQTASLLAKCRLILCDIAPLGIAAAELARRDFGSTVQSVLIENFTWDWIYQGYARKKPFLNSYIDYLRELFNRADIHIQAEPICAPSKADFRILPAARSVRQGRRTIREQIGLPESSKVILVTMGGIAGAALPLKRLAAMERDCSFLLAGQPVDKLTVQGNLHLLPQANNLWHPDLIAACDAVVGKIGYSTLAEVFQAGVPYGAVCRPRFRESEVLAAFAKQKMPCLLFSEEQFENGSWLDMLPELLALPPKKGQRQTGAAAAAEFLSGILL
jgi:UDP:flavonoid glycosyltransferase YjiC (YdhE family)